ncbi:hypothetical protein [Desulfospira joergensenii]|uniref:hypothetical protein n=1 Tax=Desulfospira joergensenii TaxID=53329 RepID=UPI0003B3B562|nr:hypothetical protein [Desulfospira joergensenii]
MENDLFIKKMTEEKTDCLDAYIYTFEGTFRGRHFYEEIKIPSFKNNFVSMENLQKRLKKKLSDSWDEERRGKYPVEDLKMF